MNDIVTGNHVVTTYNMLSSNLGSAEYYPKCKPAACDPKLRYPILQEKLAAEVDKRAIICLQEISLSWASNLHSYFASNGYYLITGMYGSRFNGYMGVGIAVPHEKYEIVDSDISCIATTRRLPRRQKGNPFIEYVMSIFRVIFNMKKPEDTAWEAAANRHNQMVSLRLRSKDPKDRLKTFCVGTYHMPCMYRLPAVMLIHSAMSAQHIQKFAKKDPYIFTGDFNIQPMSSAYCMLTTGSVSDDCSDIPEKENGCDLEFKVKPMRSAYKTKTGAEPVFTNYAQTKEDSQPFIGTLDYIYLSDEWIVDAVSDTPKTIEEMNGPLPTLREPSDHILISATLT